jgi:hypothetical protein
MNIGRAWTQASLAGGGPWEKSGLKRNNKTPITPMGFQAAFNGREEIMLGLMIIGNFLQE